MIIINFIIVGLTWNEKLYQLQHHIIKIMDKHGPDRYIIILFIDCLLVSFVRSFIASAIGWVTPKINSLFGPFRYCEKPMILRSIRVKKATLSSTPTSENKNSVRKIKGLIFLRVGWV